MEGLGDMVGPGSMLVIGMVVAESDLKKVFTDKRAYAICLGRLIIMPASILLLFSLTGIPGKMPLLVPVFQVCFIFYCIVYTSGINSISVDSIV